VIILITWIVSIYPAYQFIRRSLDAKKAYESVYTFLTSEDKKNDEAGNTVLNDINFFQVDTFILKFGEYSVELCKNFNKSELVSQLQVIIDDAIGYGNKLNALHTSSASIKQCSSELAEMCSNVRMLQWKYDKEII